MYNPNSDTITTLQSDQKTPQESVQTVLDVVTNKKLAELNDKTLSRYFEIFAQSNVTTLDFKGFALKTLSASQLKIIFEGIAKNPFLKVLVLQQGIESLDTERLRVVFENIANNKNITSLNLNANNIGRMPILSLEILSEHISKSSISSLELSDNKLGELNHESSKLFFNWLSRSQVTKYILQWNQFYNMPENTLEMIFTYLSSRKIELLDLNSNEFEQFQNTKLTAIFKPLIRKNIDSLDLSNNNLAHKNVDLKSLFEMISQIDLAVSLDLHSNDLGNLKSDRMALVFSPLTNLSISSIDVSNNHLIYSSCQLANNISPKPIDIVLDYIKKSSVLQVKYSPLNSVVEANDFNEQQQKSIDQLLLKSAQKLAFWAETSVATTFMRADPNSKIKNSIFSLLPEIFQLAGFSKLPHATSIQNFSHTLYFKAIVKTKPTQGQIQSATSIDHSDTKDKKETISLKK
jgi:hypothetical protein